jgi:hypothetical protein
VQRVLAASPIKERIGALAIGLAADCDAPEQEVDEVLHKNLPGASTLPFVGFLTFDGEWIDGASGYLEPAELQALLDRVEKSPLLDAKPAVRKQLEKPAATATAAAAKSDWKAVLVAAREAAKSTGRCPERTAIRAAEQQARAWATGELDGVVKDAAAGAELPPLRKRLAAVRGHFAGEPEAADVDTGLKALQRLQVVREVEAAPNPARDLRERSAAPYQGTRWTAVFTKPAADAPAK